MNSATSAPAQKLTVGGGASAVAVVVLYLLSKYAGFDPPPDVTLALGGIITAVVFFVAGYITPPAAKDTPVPKGSV